MHTYAYEWQRAFAIAGSTLIEISSQVSRLAGIAMHGGYNLIGLPLRASLTENRNEALGDREALAFVAKLDEIARVSIEGQTKLGAAYTPMNTARDPTNWSGRMSLYERLRREAPNASLLWAKAGLEKEFKSTFPNDADFWHSSLSFVEIYKTLTQASKTLPVERIVGPSKTTPSTRNEEWEKYLEENGLNIPSLRSTFTPAVAKTLLEDQALRPVFLVQLEEKELGPIEPIDRYALEQASQFINLNSFSGFFTGSVEVANELALHGRRIIVGVSDRSSPNLTFLFSVANGRQCYFPLPDGTWLGVKGVGQFNDPSKPPAYAQNGRSRHEGLAMLEEAEASSRHYSEIKNTSGPFIQTIAYRRIHKITDGHGGWIDADALKTGDGRRVNPVLIFNRTLSPHRLVKFPQVLEADPHLEKISRSVSVGLMNEGLAEAPLSPADLMKFIASRLGVAEAIKQNHSLFKNTINMQDATFGGEETDNEELLPEHEYLSLLRQGQSMAASEDEDLVRQHHVGIIGLYVKVRVFTEMLVAAEDRGELNELFPDRLAVLLTLYRQYFQALEDRYLGVFIKIEPGQDFSRALRGSWRDLRLDLFHEQSSGWFTQNEGQLKEVRAKVQQLACDEWKRRHPNGGSSSGPNAPQGRALGKAA